MYHFFIWVGIMNECFLIWAIETRLVPDIRREQSKSESK
jgi:hypothetical protein